MIPWTSPLKTVSWQGHDTVNKNRTGRVEGRKSVPGYCLVQSLIDCCGYFHLSLDVKKLKAGAHLEIKDNVMAKY